MAEKSEKRVVALMDPEYACCCGKMHVTVLFTVTYSRNCFLDTIFYKGYLSEIYKKNFKIYINNENKYTIDRTIIKNYFAIFKQIENKFFDPKFFSRKSNVGYVRKT